MRGALQLVDHGDLPLDFLLGRFEPAVEGVLLDGGLLQGALDAAMRLVLVAQLVAGMGEDLVGRRETRGQALDLHVERREIGLVAPSARNSSCVSSRWRITCSAMSLVSSSEARWRVASSWVSISL